MTRDGDAVVLEDRGAPLETTAPQCGRIAAGGLRCRVSTATSVRLDVRTGDGDDEVVQDLPGGLPGVTATAFGEAGADVLTAAGGDPATLIGGPGDDMLTGGTAFDTLLGGPGADRLAAGAGDDKLSGEGPGGGSVGDDLLDGGPGSDGVLYEERTEPVAVDLVDAAPDGAAGEADVLRGIENVFGGAGTDRLAGDDGPNLLFACPPIRPRCGGADVLAGRGGKDELTGSSGGDRLDGGDADDFLLAGAGADELFGGAGDDFLNGQSGTDRVDGGTGDDQGFDGAGADRYRLGDGDDRLVNPSGAGARQRDDVSCGAGADAIFAPSAADRLAVDCDEVRVKGVRVELGEARGGVRVGLGRSLRCRATARLPGDDGTRLTATPVFLRSSRRTATLRVRLDRCAGRPG